ncbi:MAG: OmpA family protein [Glaciimonas sp.]|nr:OmpA family protein [Glaciimonas sp.]
MKQFKLGALALAVTLASAGCANMDQTQQGMGIGAGAGALAGAAIGALTGNKKNALIGGAIGAGLGGAGGALWGNKQEQQKRAMEKAAEGTGIAVTQTANNELKLAVPDAAGFQTGKSNVQPTLARVLDSFSQNLRQTPASVINVAGFTDSTGTDAINNPLSQARADAVRNYLGQRGVPNRVTAQGYGSTNPVADNNTDAGRAANRRVEIYVAETQQQQQGQPPRQY